MKTASNGLDFYHHRADKGGDHFREYFVHEFSADEVLILACDKDGPGRLPDCNTHRQMPNGRTSYWYRYDKVHLPEWEKIDASVRCLINSFEMKSSG